AAALADQPGERSVAFRQLPRQADGWRELLVVDLIAGFACCGGVKGWGLAARRARLEKVADAGDAPHARVTGTCVNSVQVDRRILEIPADAVVQCQAGLHPPRILEVQTELALLVFHDRR